MKLLSTPEGKSRLEQDNASQELRSLALDDIIRQKRREINDLEKDFIHALTTQGSKNYEEEKLWKQKITNLSEEVLNLERRKEAALVPLEQKVTELQDKESVLLKREEIASIKESDLEYTKDLLEDKLDKLSEREQTATEYANTLSAREARIKIQEEHIEERMKALTQMLKESYESISEAQTQIAKDKALLKGRDVSITEREKLIAKVEAGFADREKAIVDRYKTLQRAITETNLKQNAISSTKRTP